MPGLQDRPPDSNRNRPEDVSGSTVAENGLIVKSPAHVVDWPWTAFVEAWAGLRSHTDFDPEKVTATPAGAVLVDASRPYPPRIPRQSPPFRTRSDRQKNIQSP